MCYFSLPNPYEILKRMRLADISSAIQTFIASFLCIKNNSLDPFAETIQRIIVFALLLKFLRY